MTVLKFRKEEPKSHGFVPSSNVIIDRGAPSPFEILRVIILLKLSTWVVFLNIDMSDMTAMPAVNIPKKLALVGNISHIP